MRLDPLFLVNNSLLLLSKPLFSIGIESLGRPGLGNAVLMDISAVESVYNRLFRFFAINMHSSIMSH